MNLVSQLGICCQLQTGLIRNYYYGIESFGRSQLVADALLTQGNLISVSLNDSLKKVPGSALLLRSLALLAFYNRRFRFSLRLSIELFPSDLRG